MDKFGANDPKFVAMRARADPNVYVKYWKVPLMKTLPEKPGFCCYALWCSQCASFGLRKQALHGDLSRYVCCNGACPCSGRCGEAKCPACCLCMEVSFCFAMSVSTTRFMIQDELRIQTTKCDTCIIGTMIALEYIACICHIAACISGSEEIRLAANIVQLIADLVWCSVCACMQTQHKVEMEERDKAPGAMAYPHQAPQVQAIPVAAGVPYQGPPPGYPQPQYPQPQYQGPPAGYPQQPYPQQPYPQQPYPNQQMQR